MSSIAKNGAVLPENRTPGAASPENHGISKCYPDPLQDANPNAQPASTCNTYFSEFLSESITLRVAGVPAPGGSKRAFVNRRTGRAIVVEDCKRNKTWREDVRAVAIEAMQGRELLTGPLQVFVTFYLPRPKNHYRTGKHSGELKSNAPWYHITKPDATKLWRSTEDALTGIIWRDDAQVAEQVIQKHYAAKPGAVITVSLAE